MYVFKNSSQFIINAGKQESLTWPSASTPFSPYHPKASSPAKSKRNLWEYKLCLGAPLLKPLKEVKECFLSHSKIQTLIMAWMGLYYLADTCPAPVPWLYLLGSLPPSVVAALVFLLLLALLQHVNPSSRLCLCLSSLLVSLPYFIQVSVLISHLDCDRSWLPHPLGTLPVSRPRSSQWFFIAKLLIMLCYLFSVCLCPGLWASEVRLFVLFSAVSPNSWNSAWHKGSTQ